MGSPSELSLDCKPNSCSMTDTLKLEEYLARLEEERLKIDAFKRELPLCMQLLNNAMEVYKQQLDRYHVNGESGPVLEEFIPLKRVTTEGLDKMQNSSEKISWMTSAQLWSQADNEDTKQQTAKIKDIDNEFEINTKIGLDNNNNTKQRNAGAFLPFSKEMSPKFIPPLRVIPDLALGSIEKVMEENTISETENGKKENCTKGNSVVSPTSEVGKGTSVETPQVCFNTPSTATAIQTQRKARRCWSPDLHRRFVNALQMLGGSQVATPKQIRELMKVDGLTNDEVKSHLQKYRLHTRRPSPSQQAAAAAPQLVVLGGIWVPPEYATAAAHGAGTAMYGGAPHGSAHYYSSPVPQDFYPSSPHQLHHHQRNHGYRTAPQRHSSPESDVRPAGERSESIEDEGKSESSSWKGESGEKIRSLRDEGEESNGSEITLKF